MRRSRRRLIWGLVLTAVVSGGVVFYYQFVNTKYETTACYLDTEVVQTRAIPRSLYRFEPRQGRVVLEVERGEPDGVFTTAHAWVESVAVEIPKPAVGDRIDLAGPGIRVRFVAAYGGDRWVIGPGGVQGQIVIEAVSNRRMTASYDIVVTGYNDQILPGYQHRKFEFRGRDTFPVEPRPDGEMLGSIWPALVQVPPPGK